MGLSALLGFNHVSALAEQARSALYGVHYEHTRHLSAGSVPHASAGDPHDRLALTRVLVPDFFFL